MKTNITLPPLLPLLPYENSVSLKNQEKGEKKTGLKGTNTGEKVKTWQCEINHKFSPPHLFATKCCFQYLKKWISDTVLLKVFYVCGSKFYKNIWYLLQILFHVGSKFSPSHRWVARGGKICHGLWLKLWSLKLPPKKTDQSWEKPMNWKNIYPFFC